MSKAFYRCTSLENNIYKAKFFLKKFKKSIKYPAIQQINAVINHCSKDSYPFNLTEAKKIKTATNWVLIFSPINIWLAH